MTFAWYGHLKFFHGWSLPLTIFLSWGIALFEYIPDGSRKSNQIQRRRLQHIPTQDSTRDHHD